MKKLRIFAASPSDTAAERASVEKVALMLKPLADNLEIVLDVYDWHEVVPEMGRPEQVILNQLKPTSWDVFIGILWHRFGTPPASHDPQTQKEYLAGTEEEFKTAYRLWEQNEKPRIMMYRCTRAIPQEALDPDQFKRVKEFFAQFEAVKGAHPGLYQSFDTTEAFENLLLDNLQKLLLEYSEEIKGQPVAPEVVQIFAPRISDNLPRRAPFFGRDRDMDIVLRALSPEDRTWGVLLDGIGGIGKTALAVEAAYRCKEKGLFDAFCFVSAKYNILDPNGIHELKPAARTLDEFLNETALVLSETGIAKLAGNDKRRALLGALRKRAALLIYDNLETLAKEEQEALADFLRELPQACKAIITSRRRGGEGAVWLRLEKLEWEAAQAIIENEMGRDRQLASKLRRAGKTGWQELYDETKGSPLALTHTLGLIRVRVTLTFNDALKLLRGNSDPDLQKFIFQEARQELSVNDENALRTLSFFAPSATFEAWMKVAELSRNALETTIDRLSALSLLDILPGEERYGLHPLTQNFVRGELLADAQIARDSGMRFSEYWVDYARRHGGRLNYKTFNLIDTEWANLDAAAEWLWQRAEEPGKKAGNKTVAQSLDTLADALCSTNGPLLFVGRWDESMRLSAHAYEIMYRLKDWSKAGWRAHQVAWVHFYRDNFDEAERWVDRSVEAWKQGGSKLEQGLGLRMLGRLAVGSKSYDEAEQFFRDALAIYSDLKYDEWTADVLSDLGGLERARQSWDTAEKYYREALKIYQLNNRITFASILFSYLGLLALDRKRWTEARELFEEALRIAREVGRQDTVAECLDGLARAYEAEGHLELALPLAQEALVIRERLHHGRTAMTRSLMERLKKKSEHG